MNTVQEAITIACILTATGVAISVLVKPLLPSGGIIVGGKPPPKDKKGVKEWLRQLLGRLDTKSAEVLPSILKGIFSWVLTKAKELVDWITQNLC